MMTPKVGAALSYPNLLEFGFKVKYLLELHKPTAVEGKQTLLAFEGFNRMRFRNLARNSLQFVI